jgi:hypothetical protein
MLSNNTCISHIHRNVDTCILVEPIRGTWQNVEQNMLKLIRYNQRQKTRIPCASLDNINMPTLACDRMQSKTLNLKNHKIN